MDYLHTRELYHHGILGMKWGKRNGPPYPLGVNDHSASEKKAGWKKSIVKSGHNENRNQTTTSNKKFELTDSQKKALKIGVIAAGTALAAYGGYKLYKSGALDVFANKGRSAVPKDILGLDPDTPRSDFKLTENNLQQCAANVNPTHSRTNCGSTASAVLANMNGGNYEALPEVPEHMRIRLSNGELGHGYDPEKLIQCYEGGKWNTISGGSTRRKMTEALEKEILSYGEGAKGIFYPEQIRKRSSGHYFSWVVQNGKVKVIEGQASDEGIVWDNDLYDDVGQLFDPMFDVRVARLDNCPIKPDRETDLFRPRSKN